MMTITRQILLILLVLGLGTATLYAQDEEHGADHSQVENAEDEAALSNTAIMVISLGLGVVSAGISWLVAKDRLGILQYGIIILLVTTGFIHVLYTLLSDLLLFANGVGYLGLAILYLLPMATEQPYKRLLNGITIIYTLITIIGYFVVHLEGHFDLIGIATKAVELALVGAVALYMFRSQTSLSKN